MKKSIYGIGIILSICFCMAFNVHADELEYTGDGTMLKTTPSWEWDIENSLFPGTTASPVASDNEITINYVPGAGMTDPKAIYGGLSQNEDSNNNKVTFENGRMDYEEGTRYIYGGRSVNGSASDNVVVINGGDLENVMVYGGHASVDSMNNKVTVNGVTLGMAIGGFAYDGLVQYNTVEINGGQLLAVTGAETYSNYDISYNNVIINGGQVEEWICGATSEGNGNVTYNTVTIRGNVILHPDSTEIIGGDSTNDVDVFTGNTLNIETSGLTALSVYNFEFYNFYLPRGITAGTTVLSITNGIDLADTKMDITMQGVSGAFNPGDAIIIIDALDSAITGAPDEATVSGSSSSGLIDYDFELKQTDSQLLLEVTGSTVNQGSQSITNSRIAPLAFLNQGADLLAFAALEAACVPCGEETKGRVSVFATAGGGSSRYDTGSGAHVDVDGVSVVAGLAWHAPTNFNALNLSAFFESGWGNYDTRNRLVKSKGDLDYYGGGVMGRYQFTVGYFGGLYADGSFRVGHASSDYSKHDFDNAFGGRNHYDTGSTYYGAHAGLGYAWQVDDKICVDFSSKYFWTHLNSSRVNINGDSVKLDDVTSHRWRNGAVLNYDVTEMVTAYVGAAYEYEFDGKAKAQIYSHNAPYSDIKGGTGIGTLGIMLNPAGGGFSVNLGIQGYTGVREGVSGSFKAQYTF